MQIYSVSILNYSDWILETIIVRAWSRRGAVRQIRKHYGNKVGIRSIEKA